MSFCSTCLQKKGNMQARLLPLGRLPAGGPWLASRNLDLGGSPGFAELIRVAHCVCTICPNSMVYAELQLSSWESGIWVQARHRVPV